MDGDVWPVLAEDALTEGIAFNKANGCEPTNKVFSGIGEPTDAREQVQ
jgi:hypothetical protein